MDLRLRGRRALVTGATAGIGKQIALTLAAEGAALVLVGRRQALLQEVAAQALAAGAERATGLALDLMDDGAVARAAAGGREALGGIDILVNCMGASRPVGLDASDADWDEAMTLNWTRHRQLTGQVLPSMRAQRWGRVINVTGPNETTGLNAAGVAKVAVHAWAKGVSDLVAGDGVTVNCIGPGKINSEQLNQRYSEAERDAFSKLQIPTGRFGEAHEFADLVVFLASPRASYITGAVMHVDGGLRRYMF